MKKKDLEDMICSERSLSKEERQRIDGLMKRGIVENEVTGLTHFTGYSNTTLYDWDQYFEAITQLYMGWGTQYIKNAVLIYLLCQQENGFTKRAIQNGYSGEEDYEMVKPFLSQITLLCLKWDGNTDWLDGEMFERLGRSLDYWLYERDKNENDLSIWRSSIETGMDNQHERGGVWKSDYCEGVDLNTYLYRECLAYAELCDSRGESGWAEQYRRQAELRKQAVLSLWDEKDAYFYDRDERTGEPIRVKSIAGMLPLWAGIVSDEQAWKLVSRHILNPGEFWRNYPLPALSADEPGYSPVPLQGDIGCCWRANTWVPTNYMMMHGLIDYGYFDIARYLAEKTRELAEKSGDREYYVTETGDGMGLNPFWGWSLLAFFMEEECERGINPTEL